MRRVVLEFNKLFVASGDDGMLRVFRGDTLELVDSIHLEPGPNRVVYETKSKLVYVGYGGKDAGKDYGEVGVIDARNHKLVGDIRVVAHPSELLLDKAGTKRWPKFNQTLKGSTARRASAQLGYCLTVPMIGGIGVLRAGFRGGIATR